MLDESPSLLGAGSQFRNLADPTGYGVGVAFPTGLGVVDGAQSILDALALFKNTSCLVECNLIHRTVRLIIKTRRSFGGAGLTGRTGQHRH